MYGYKDYAFSIALLVIIPLTGFGSDKATYGLIKTYFKTNLEQDDLDTIFEHNPKVLEKLLNKLVAPKKLLITKNMSADLLNF